MRPSFALLTAAFYLLSSLHAADSDRDFSGTWLLDREASNSLELGAPARLGRTAVTRWNAEPWVLGAFSSAAPGAQGSRRILMEPVHGRLFLAGEAVHETLWGTVGGAWESGERAADAALKLFPAARR